MKRKLSLILTCTMLIGAVPVFASEVNEETTGFETDLTFTVDEEGDITEYSVGEEKFAVNEYYNDKYLNTTSYTYMGSFDPVGRDTVFIDAYSTNPGAITLEFRRADTDAYLGTTVPIYPGSQGKSVQIPVGNYDVKVSGKGSVAGTYGVHIQSRD